MVKFLAALVSLVVVVETAQALPVERFRGAIDLACSPDDVCGSFARAAESLGGKLGVSIAGGRRSKARVRARSSAVQPSLEVNIPGEGVGALTLSWDGDPHPHQLSSAGLGCLNLRADGAIAFRIESFEARGACEAQPGAEQSCQPITIETRVYDPSDPTGQRYSASILRRSIPRRGALDIPFSNFIHRGPRGAATFECVGAVSISFKIEGQRGLILELGAVETVGIGAERSRVATPVATTTPLPRPTYTPQPRPTELRAPQPTLVPTTQPSREASASSAGVKASPPRTAMPVATRVPIPRATTPVPPQQEVSEPASQSTLEAEPPVERLPSRESVFGAVIAPPAPPTAAATKRSRRRLWD